MFTSMGQAANYLCSEPELQELQIASETERAAWWTTSHSLSSYTRCWKTSPKIDKKPVNILLLALFNCKFPFQFFSCEIFGNVKISKLLPTKNRFWKWHQQRSGPFQTWPLPFPTTLRKPWFFQDENLEKQLRVFVGRQSSYVALFFICIFESKLKELLGSSLPAFEALNFKPWVRKYSVDLDRTAFHPFSHLPSSHHQNSLLNVCLWWEIFSHQVPQLLATSNRSD